MCCYILLSQRSHLVLSHSLPPVTQVTHMLLLGSDAPGVYQLAVILSSGTILFYDLATYCVPGAAWHPDCCMVGCGHLGRVSTTLEVTFKCPPQHLLGPAWGADASSAGHHTPNSLARPVSWQFSSSAARGSHSGRSSLDGGNNSSGDGGRPPPHSLQNQSYHQQQEDDKQQQWGVGGGVCPAVAQGWCSRPVQGGVVPLLLTGGRDGSLRGWDLRLEHLGQPWMAVHPHTGKGGGLVRGRGLCSCGSGRV